jgi:hypothetical protein
VIGSASDVARRAAVEVSYWDLPIVLRPCNVDSNACCAEEVQPLQDDNSIWVSWDFSQQLGVAQASPISERAVRNRSASKYSNISPPADFRFWDFANSVSS